MRILFKSSILRYVYFLNFPLFSRSNFVSNLTHFQGIDGGYARTKNGMLTATLNNFPDLEWYDEQTDQFIHNEDRLFKFLFNPQVYTFLKRLPKLICQTRGFTSSRNIFYREIPIIFLFDDNFTVSLNDILQLKLKLELYDY